MPAARQRLPAFSRPTGRLPWLLAGVAILLSLAVSFVGLLDERARLAARFDAAALDALTLERDRAAEALAAQDRATLEAIARGLVRLDAVAAVQLVTDTGILFDVARDGRLAPPQMFHEMPLMIPGAPAPEGRLRVWPAPVGFAEAVGPRLPPLLAAEAVKALLLLAAVALIQRRRPEPDAALRRQAGQLVHDFNNMLGAVRGFARLLADDPQLGPESRHCADRILLATDRSRLQVQQLQEELRPPAPPPAPAAPPPAAAPADPATILVVDDDPAACELLEAALSRAGHDVVTTEDPIDALASLAEAPEAWDMLVTDLAMPGMDGADLIARARALRPQLACVLVTGSPDRAAQAGADVVLAKPVDVDRLLALIAERKR